MANNTNIVALNKLRSIYNLIKKQPTTLRRLNVSTGLSENTLKPYIEFLEEFGKIKTCRECKTLYCEAIE
jgi:hypothetical protein